MGQTLRKLLVIKNIHDSWAFPLLSFHEPGFHSRFMGISTTDPTVTGSGHVNFCQIFSEVDHQILR